MAQSYKSNKLIRLHNEFSMSKSLTKTEKTNRKTQKRFFDFGQSISLEVPEEEIIPEYTEERLDYEIPSKEESVPQASVMSTEHVVEEAEIVPENNLSTFDELDKSIEEIQSSNIQDEDDGNDFEKDLQDILSGRKTYNPVEESQPQAQNTPEPTKQKQDASGEEEEDHHSIFDKMGKKMQSAQSYDMGTFELDKNLEEFDNILDKQSVPVKKQQSKIEAEQSDAFFKDLDEKLDIEEIKSIHQEKASKSLTANTIYIPEDKDLVSLKHYNNFRHELSISENIGKGSKKHKDIRKIKEWLKLWHKTDPHIISEDVIINKNYEDSDIDEIYDDAVEEQIKLFQKHYSLEETGIVTPEIFKMLSAPLKQCFEVIKDDNDIRSLINKYAERFCGKAYELKVESLGNLGPWVRSFIGIEGNDALWCARFAQTVLDLAFSTIDLDFTEKVVQSGLCDEIYNHGKKKDQIIENNEIPKRISEINTGDLFLSNYNSTTDKWHHIGIITGVNENSFSKIDGNSGDKVNSGTKNFISQKNCVYKLNIEE